ncbi:hypothetical protein ABPG74_007626 [Tetrahymena malaccensis]
MYSSPEPEECKLGLMCTQGLNCQFYHSRKQQSSSQQTISQSNIIKPKSNYKSSHQKLGNNQRLRSDDPNFNPHDIYFNFKNQENKDIQNQNKQKNDDQKEEEKSDFVYYKDEQNCQDDIPQYQKCYQYNISGKCDLKRCDKSPQFKLQFKCAFASLDNKFQCNMSEYTKKSNYDCNKLQNIKKFHKNQVDGFCNTKIVQSKQENDYRPQQKWNQNNQLNQYNQFSKSKNLKKEKNQQQTNIQKKQPQFNQLSESQIEKNEQPKNILTKQPQFIYYQGDQNYEEKISQSQKCHWYDIFGKCDTNQCKLNHNFKPQYECCYMKSSGQCSCQYPKYTLNRYYNCNNNKQPKKCHDYNLEGICNSLVCPFIHKEILRKCEFSNCKLCQQKRDKIKEDIESMQNTLKSEFQYNPNRLKQVCYDMQTMIINQKELIKQQETFDLMFIVDCTSSMQPWIDFVKQSIRDIIDQIKKTYSTFSFRYSFVGYRDFGDAKVKNFDFNEDLNKFIKHLDAIIADGGEDIPEDMASGLKEGLNQNFRSKVKAVFLLYDAPNHGLQYHDGVYYDKYQGNNIEPLIQNYAQNNIYFTSIMLKYNGEYIAQKTLEAIENEYKRCNKTKQFYQTKAEQGPNQKIQEFIQTTIETTIKHSKQNKPSQLVEKIDNPIFKELQFEKDYLIQPYNQYIRPFDFPIQWKNLFIIEEKSSQEYVIKLKDQFKDGTQRRAYVGKDETLNREIAIKFDLKINPNENLYDQMKDQQESQVVSSYIVSKFRDLVIPYVQNLQSLPYYIGANIAKLNMLNSFCYTEVLLSDFDKFSNNAEYQKEAKTENEQLLECLPHFSFQYTEGYLMITDLQGHGSILTDPCVHTLDQKKYGSTNLGQLGISKYFAKHTCNQFCMILKLIHPNDTKSVQNFDCDYIKQVEENSDSRLQTLKHIQEIQKYKNKTLFCEVCEHFELKDTEINSQKCNDLKQFVKDHCIECKNKVKGNMQKIQCSQCNIQVSVPKYWIKMKKGNMNGKCQYCNKRNYLKDLCQFYLDKIPKPPQI